MKKLMMMTLMVIVANTAFAQGDAIKEIMRAKEYTAAANLVKSNLQSLADEDKAKAYNKLVDLSMEKVTKEMGIMSENGVYQQMKQNDKVKVLDTLGLYNAVNQAIKDAMVCDKYDQLPNAKGKVKARFRDANAARLYSLRSHLINAGQDAANTEKREEALDNYALYVESASSPLFTEAAKKAGQDKYLGEVARVAAVYAYQNKKMDLAEKYCDVAMLDTATHKDALDLKVYLMSQNLQSHADSVQYANKLKDLYAQNSNSDQMFSSLANMYSALNMKSEQEQIINEKLAKDPKNFSALALKGQSEMYATKYDAAIEDFKKALEVDAQNPIVLTYVGFCMNSKAGGIANNIREQKALYVESMGYLEKAKEVDPNREKANWVYPLYQCYYNLYGAADPRTKTMEGLVK